MSKLIEITAEKFDVILELRYASTNNVCEKILYSKPLCYICEEIIEAFKTALKLAKNSGYKIKIWDCYRPIEVQKFMYERFPENGSEGGFISNPSNGAIPHCRGVAIDLTLCDLEGNEIEMGTDFDNFTPLAFHDCKEVSEIAQKNRLILLEIMTLAGLDSYSKEWWHYQAFNARQFPIIEAPRGFSAV
jgi:D-alanyl-D-alanine dipeptidase